MRRFIVTLSLLIAATAPAIKALAQDPVPLSLDDCMNYAMKHNYSAKNAQLDILIQKAQNSQTVAAAYPHINGKAEFDAYPNLPVTFFPGAFGKFIDSVKYKNVDPNSFVPVALIPRYSGSTSVSASQTLFDGSVLVALQARNTVLELARQGAEVTKENVRYNIYKAYYSLVIAYRQLDIITNSLTYARNIQHDILVTQQNGLAEKIEVERTDVQVNNLATDSFRISNLLTVSEQLLKYQMGMNVNTPIVLTDTNIEENKAEALSLLDEQEEYERVPEFKLYQTRLLLNEYNVRRYKLSALPTLTLIGNAGYNYQSNDFNDLLAWRKNYVFSTLVGVQLNMPIFNGLLRVNQLKEARIDVAKSQNDIDNMKLTIDFQSAQSKTTLRNAILQAQSQHRNVDLANDVLDLAQKKYKAGVGSNLEVTQAQTDLLSAENNYFNALLDITNAKADLKKALGLLSNN